MDITGVVVPVATETGAVPLTLVTVPPLPVAEIEIPPALLVIVTPDPAVRLAATGAAPVEPIKSCPFVKAAASPIAVELETIIRFPVNAPVLVPPLATGRTPVVILLASKLGTAV